VVGNADDTNAAAGGQRGALHGASGIPAQRLGKLAGGELREHLADRRLAAGQVLRHETP
jgi:hypothetical protein